MKAGIFYLILLISAGKSIAQDLEKGYDEIIRRMTAKRSEIKEVFVIADSLTKDSLLEVARNYLIISISEEIFPSWYGTPWDFNGMTRIPKKGKIACGYFVTNTLTDAGFNIPRIKWAQSASEVFIKKLAPKNIKRFHNSEMAEIEKFLLNSGDGLYIVGLDNHVGYIVVNERDIKFVHSNYYQSDIGVMAENIHTTNPLSNSKYRVIGKLLSDEMVLKWINNVKYEN